MWPLVTLSLIMVGLMTWLCIRITGLAEFK